RLAHRPPAFEGGEGDGQRQVQVDARKDGAEVRGLAVIGIAVKEGGSQAAVIGIDEEWSETQRRGFRQVFIGVAKTAMDLQRHIECAALLRRFEDERMADRVAGYAQRFVAFDM